MGASVTEGMIMSTSKGTTSQQPIMINVSEARRMLGISGNKMAALIRSGALSYDQDPLDHRVKLVRRKDVEELMRKSNHGKLRSQEIAADGSNN
jgi:hypothetical protein